MSYILTHDFATLLGTGRIVTRNEILTAFLRYCTARGLLDDRTRIIPDAPLSRLCDSEDPFPVKDLFLELRAHIKAAPAPAPVAATK